MQTNVETTDIVLAATLKVMGFQLDKIERDGSKGLFCFSRVDKDFLKQYDIGQGRVEPVSFNNAIKALTTAARRST